MFTVKCIRRSTLFIALTLSGAGCTTPADAPSQPDAHMSDQGHRAPEMTTTPDLAAPPDMKIPAPKDMGPAAPEEMTQGCQHADCVPDTTTCAGINTVRHCQRINGCVTEILVTCQAAELCEQAEGERAKCVWTLCRRDQQRMCADDQRSSITCLPTAVPGLFRPQATPCADDELCAFDTCEPHQCEEQELGIPYTCTTDNTYTRCELQQGRRTLLGPVTCPPLARCVPGKFVSAIACECEHQCERYNQVRCDPNHSGAYQICDITPDKSCRYWRQLPCPAPRPNVNFEWHDMGCHPSAQGQAHLKCWTNDGHCSLDQEPDRCL